MAFGQIPGPRGAAGRPREQVRDGTNALIASPLPGVLGAGGGIAIFPTDLVDRVRAAVHWADVSPWVVRLLGPKCFSIGVAHGIGLEVVGSAVEIARLAKTFVLADIADSALGPAPGSPLRFVPIIVDPYSLLKRAVGAVAAYAFESELREAQAERDALIEAIGYAFTHPGEFFESVGKDYVERWEKFTNLAAKNSLSAQYEAGKIFGGFLLEVLSLIATGGAILKLAERVPKLAKVMTRLKRAAESLKKKGPIVEPGAAAEAKPAPRRQPSEREKPDALKAKNPYQYYMAKVDELDVQTPRDKAVFYSGPGNSAKARAFAGEGKGMTLEDTAGGKWLDRERLYDQMSAEEADRVWARLSERYAKQATGEVNVFAEGARPDRVFNTVEKPILEESLKAGKVTGITYH